MRMIKSKIGKHFLFSALIILVIVILFVFFPTFLAYTLYSFYILVQKILSTTSILKSLNTTSILKSLNTTSILKSLFQKILSSKNKIIISKDTLFNIGAMELGITTAAMAIMVISLGNTDKKLYGIQLSKIMIMRNLFIARLLILLLIIILTPIPIIQYKTSIILPLIISLFYFPSSLLASYFIIETMYALAYPEEEYEKSVKKFYKDKIVSKKDFTTLVEENLCPYMYELIEKRNFGEYNRNFEFLIELFLTIRKNDYKETELLNFMEDKIYEVLKLTETYLPSPFDLNIKILRDENYQELSRLDFSNIEKRRAILNLAGKLSMKIIII